MTIENQLGLVGERIYDQMERDDIYFSNYPPDEIEFVGHKTYLLIRALSLEISKLENRISDIESTLGVVSAATVKLR